MAGVHQLTSSLLHPWGNGQQHRKTLPPPKKKSNDGTVDSPVPRL